MKIYRQGDIILRQVNGNLSRYSLTDDKLEIKGETGETHLLEAPVFSPVIVRGVPTPLPLVVVVKPLPMTHPQHPDLVIEPGVYEVGKVRTFTPESIRYAFD